MKIFTINGKTYKSAPFDFNMVCELEEKRISLADIKAKPLTFVRSYFATCMGADKATAGKEIEAHLLGGGKLDDIMDVLSYEIEESGFFQNLNKTEEQTASTDQKAEKAETK